MGLEDGSEEARGAGAFPPAVTKLPLLQRLFRKFSSSAPRPRVVRVDTEQSYAAWKNDRRAPYRAELARCVAERDAQDGLNPDEHVQRIEDAEQSVINCGEAVPLSLPPHARGKVKCWQEGNEIFASVCTRSADGSPRVITTSTTVQQHVEQVVGYATDAGVDPFVVVGILPVLAQVLGGGALVTQICRAAPAFTHRPNAIGYFVVKANGSPAIAAAMALLQKARGGDMDARGELAMAITSPRGQKLFDEASRLLAQAHKERS
jgi:hypothetical protein